MTVLTDVIFEDFTDSTGNAVRLPPCAKGGIQVAPQQIMSDNAGRNSNTGTFYGDVKAVKNVVTLMWNRLNESDFAVIDRCLNNFISDHRVTMRLRPSEGYVTRHYYLGAGSYNYTEEVQLNGQVYYSGVTAQLIER